MIALTSLWLATPAISQTITIAEAKPPPESVEGLGWDFTTSHRYFIETEVQLPEMIWLGTENNTTARVDWFDLRLVTQCDPGVAQSRRTSEISCRIEDLAISARSLPQEAGLVQLIVDEVDDRLTGASVQLQVRQDGRLINIDLEDLERRNRRYGWINENLRLVVSRAFAGLDLPLPDPQDEAGWLQHSGWLMRAPDPTGSAGSSEIVHQIVDRRGETVKILSSGHAIIAPGTGWNQYEARMGGEAVFDGAAGRLLERSWSLAGGPTASSRIAQGTEGYPYLQQGRIVALPEGQSWELGASLEIAGDGGQTAIQQSTFLGMDPD